MEEFLYVQVDENNLAVGFSQLSGEVSAPNMIRVGNHGDYLGKKWTGTGWEEVAKEPSEPLPPEPTELEKQVTAIKADLELIKALTIQTATPPSDVPDMPPMPSGMDMPDMPPMP